MRLAVYILDRIACAESIQPLIASMKDKDSDVRCAVVKALGKIETFNDFCKIRKILHNETEFSVKLASAIVLLKTNDEQAKKYVID